MSQQQPRGSRPSLPSPSNGTLGAGVAVIALVLGFLILRDVRNDGGTTSPGVGNSSAVTVAPGGTIDPNAPASTVPFTIDGFKIQVANASGLAGSAGALTVLLQKQLYVVQPALNVAPGTAKRAKTGVFYLAGCDAAAQNVATVLGGNVDVAAMPTPIPVETATIGEACILIMLGTDLANKPLAGVTGLGNGIVVDTTTTIAG